MIRMAEKESIRKKHFVEGWSIRKVSKMFEISRQTVRKALKDSTVPVYRIKKPRKSPVMDPFREVISKWIISDRDVPKKQRHTARRIYDRLTEEYQFQGCESTVRRFVRELKKELELSNPTGFVPLTADYGEQAQVDWGTGTVVIAGETRKISLFCIKLRASKVPFVRAFPSEKTEAFLEGHRLAFEWFGGVPSECHYDNLKTAVTRIIKGSPDREEAKEFSSLRSHYLFDSHFCNVRSGNEKGSVENLVGYIRRNTMVPIPDVLDLETLNVKLLDWCEREKDRHRDKWKQEQRALRPLPLYPFDTSTVNSAIVSSTGLVTFDRNVYSVPPENAGKTVTVKAYWDRIVIVLKDKELARHNRLRGRGEESIQLEHYLDILERKPRASRNAVPVRNQGEDWQILRKKMCTGPRNRYREFTKILLLNREIDPTVLAKSLKIAIEKDLLSSDAIRQIAINMSSHSIEKKRKELQITDPLKMPEDLRQYPVDIPELGRYDQLLESSRVI